MVLFYFTYDVYYARFRPEGYVVTQRQTTVVRGRHVLWRVRRFYRCSFRFCSQHTKRKLIELFEKKNPILPCTWLSFIRLFLSPYTRCPEKITASRPEEVWTYHYKVYWKTEWSTVNSAARITADVERNYENYYNFYQALEFTEY